MKKILFSLLILTSFAAANSCTKAWFEINAYEYFASSDKPYLDSTHQNELNYEIDEKYVYKNGVIDSILTYHQKTSLPQYIDAFNWDEGKLIQNGSAINLSKETIGDTLVITQTYLKNDFLNQLTIKILDNYAEKKIIKASSSHQNFKQIFFSNDTLVFQTTSTYKSGETNIYKTITVKDPQDDSKCTEYDDEGEIQGQLEFKKNDNGYSIRYNDEQYEPKTTPNYKEYFMVVPEQYQYTTSIRKQHPAVKISPKARYFDLLGRYKFTK